MRKLMLLAAMLDRVLVTAAPALAQVSGEFSQSRIRSGKASPSVGVSNKGTNVNQCITAIQGTQTGNVANTQGLVQYKGTVDDVETEGSAILEAPSGNVNCTRLIEQVATAKAGGAEGKAAPKLLKTGGLAGTTSLLSLGAGALLMAGGLLACRSFR